MRRIGFILVFCAFFVSGGFAASRVATTSASSGASLTRQGTANQRVRTTVPTTKTVTRVAPAQKTVSRTATQQSSRGKTVRSATTARATNVVARATTDTRTGAEYESCKNAYFTCMDQFCQLKNDDFRRCSCSDRISTLQSAKNSLNDAHEQLVAFNENLDIVGKTAAQAAAMNTASDGENALARDTSASKALLNAIMNSIRGNDTRVENNNLSPLNSIDLSFDAANSFGTTDVGQAIASYNGTALYSAVYPSCRNAVKSSCNDASLQRAVNAYLMAIEQDCNTVQTAIQNKQKETHAAIRESSAMLDLARAENHQKHNSDDLATCIANIESAILSEEVCGANYHKCLDNGEFIDVSTGAPIAGVVDFYKLGTMLTFNADRNNAEQKLAQNPSNRGFVTAFEKRVKQFAEPALDKCYDESKTAWNDYLNKAMLDIYYAQQSKVNEIKQGCFDFVSACYMNGSDAMTNAMQGLVAAQTTNLNPNVLKLNQSLCSDYIASCNNMFDGQIIADYINNRHDTDSLTACRAVVKQCFDNYGGLNYENLYNPDSGLFASGQAPNWFSLYERDRNNKIKCNDNQFYAQTNDNPYPCVNHGGFAYKSACAQQLANIDACNAPDMIEKSFGGFDYYNNGDVYTRYAYTNNDRTGKQNRLLRSAGIATETYNQIVDILQTQCSTLNGQFMTVQNLALYSNNYSKDNFCETTFNQNDSRYYAMHQAYSIGKSFTTWKSKRIFIPPTDINQNQTTTDNTSGYNQAIDLNPDSSGKDNPDWGNNTGNGKSLSAKIPVRARAGIYNATYKYNMTQIQEYKAENMCPRDYAKNVDTASWGACLCWENGGRRSNNGTSTRCVATFPVQPLTIYNVTPVSQTEYSATQTIAYGLSNSCTKNDFVTAINQTNTGTADAPKNDPTETSSFTLWPYKPKSASDLPTENDWCNANVNTKNQVCPFGVSVLTEKPTNTTDNNYGLNAGDCAKCPFDWVTTTVTTSGTNTGNNERAEIKCCPSNYVAIKHVTDGENCANGQCSIVTGGGPTIYLCCPTEYPTINGDNFIGYKCKNTNNETVDAITATDITSNIIDDNFPQSGANIIITGND